MANAAASRNVGLRKETGQSQADSSRVAEEALKKQIFTSALKAAWDHNANADPAEVEEAIEESLAWARAQMRS